MFRKYRTLWLAILSSVLLQCFTAFAAEPSSREQTQVEDKTPPIAIADHVGDAVKKEADRVKQDLERQARSLFDRSPLGWDFSIIDFLYKWILQLPLKTPELMRSIVEQGRILGVVGSIIMLIFIAAVLYSLVGRKKVLLCLEVRLQVLQKRIPEHAYPYFLSLLKVVVASLIPLMLLGMLLLVNALTLYSAPWLELTKRLLALWAVGALLINLLRESLIKGLLPISSLHGETIFRRARPVLLYVIGGIAVFWGAENIGLPPDVLAFLRFVIAVSIVCVLFLLFLNKAAMLALVPKLPYGNYGIFLRGLEKYYFPLVFLSFLFGLLWCLGYDRFARIFLAKPWSLAGVYVAIMLLYHMLRGRLKSWSEGIDSANEAGQMLVRSIRALLLSATFTATVLISLKLLGIFETFQQIMSFPVLEIGGRPFSLWVFLEAGLTLLAFIYISRLLQAYLEYMVYPALGIGLGLQNIAANVISGFSIIFGGKLRRGDWIQVGDTRGVVTDIYLRATRDPGVSLRKAPCRLCQQPQQPDQRHRI